MLVAFMGLLALLNWLVMKFCGLAFDRPDIGFQTLLGWAFAPLASSSSPTRRQTRPRCSSALQASARERHSNLGCEGQFFGVGVCVLPRLVTRVPGFRDVPPVPRIFSRNQYAPVSGVRGLYVAEIRLQRANLHLAFVAGRAYVGGVKSILACIFAAVAFSTLSGCETWAEKKKKASARVYEGDTSPNITLYEERPGYLLNTR